jgi:Grx4 family monothiol glutaredoxin
MTNPTEQKIQELLSVNPVILFMKGDKYMPKCGYSKTVVEILNELETPYITYDILEDEELRQTLKTYSKWPTYPQLYIKGELIGGADIVKEMYLAGELQELIK